MSQGFFLNKKVKGELIIKFKIDEFILNLFFFQY